MMFKPIRCGAKLATPYIRKFLPTLDTDKYSLVVDLGCGNLRNTNFAKDLGYTNILSYDKAGDFGIQFDLGRGELPIKKGEAKIILCNYLLCFLNKRERNHLIREIDRISGKDCFLFVEMFPAKEAVPYNIKDILNGFKGSWNVKHITKHRFLIQKEE